MKGAAHVIILDALVRGAGISAILLLCTILARRGRQDPIARYGVLFGLGGASYLLCSALWFSEFIAPVYAPLLLFCMFNPLLFWFFARALFDDGLLFGRLERVLTICFSLTIAIRLGGRSFGPEFLETISGILLQVFGLALVLHVMLEAARGYADDLMERRRRLRIYAVAIVGAYMVIITIAELTLDDAAPTDVMALVNASALMVLIWSITVASLALREDLCPLVADEWEAKRGSSAVVPGGGSPAKDNVDAELIQQVLHEIEVNQAWRQEALSIADLAAKIGTQEYLLRRAINLGLGQRNFASFLNGYRLTEIEAALADSEKSHVPILTIALEAGFNSIGPFNRAFKERNGVTPSQYRRSLAPSPAADDGPQD